MNRYIDYDEFAEKHCCCGWFDGISEDELKKFIAPDVVEVVRCKDCIHHNNCEIEVAGQFGDNSFCCLGERREHDGKPITGIK